MLFVFYQTGTYLQNSCIVCIIVSRSFTKFNFIISHRRVELVSGASPDP